MDAKQAQELVGWLDLLDVALGYVDQIRTKMNSGVPATKEQFTALREAFSAEHDQVMADIDAMPADPPQGTQG